MKRIFIFVLVMAILPVAACSDFQAILDAYDGGAESDTYYLAGFKAYERGDYATAIRGLRPLADQGDADAQYILGVMYGVGQGVSQDYAQAYAWYALSADQGNANAIDNRNYIVNLMTQNQLTEGQRMAKNWRPVKQTVKQAQSPVATRQPAVANADFQAGFDAAKRGDYATAFREWEPLAKQGYALAQAILGSMYYRGQGVRQDYAQAVKWYRKAADQGNANAQSDLGVMYEKGRGVRQDYAQAVKWYRKAADQGLALAQFNLGVMYYKGHQGVRQDYAQAVKWYRKAADQGYASAQFNLGLMYAEGQGVRQDYAQAVKWYRKAADQGVAPAQASLGNMYYNGRGVRQDYAQAVKWYRKAADQGFALAQSNLGVMYGVGQGVGQDYAQAVKWYRKAADQGYAGAQSDLGVMYRDGLGVRQDYTQAVKWSRKSADQGYANAQYNLGLMYAKGQGVGQDYAQAYSWLSLAAAQGDSDAIKIRDLVAGKMTPAQIAEGQRMARNWRPVKQVAKQDQPSYTQQPASKPTAPAAQMDIAGLQRQLNEIKGMIAKKPAPQPKPKLALTPKFPTTPVAVTFRKASHRPDDVAVIIGNADYSKGRDIPDVTPAYADAAGIMQYVTQALGIRAENIIFLKDASQAEMTSTFGSETNPNGQLLNYVKPGVSRVFVYYSGHGAPGGKDGDSYIVPSNAQASTIELNGYSLKTLYRNLSKIPAKSITVVLEACFSGASQAGTVVSKASPIYLKAKETGVPANITLIAAGAANQIASWEQDESSGLFTEYFLKGMSGKADAKPYGNGDGKVEYDELGRYLNKTLTYFARRYYGREQTAQIVVGSGL